MGTYMTCYHILAHKITKNILILQIFFKKKAKNVHFLDKMLFFLTILHKNVAKDKIFLYLCTFFRLTHENATDIYPYG